jgi:hypothetical protein
MVVIPVSVYPIARYDPLVVMTLIAATEMLVDVVSEYRVLTIFVAEPATTRATLK